MSIFTDHGVEVEKVDNGYILTWSKEREEDWSEYSEFKTRTKGREIITTKKKLIERLRQLL